MKAILNTDTLAGLPRHAGEPRYDDRFLEALVVAAKMHDGQRRKGSDVPYASHLLGACSIVLDYGGSQDEAIAALLHDAIEDVDPTEEARAAVALFGDNVLRIVEGCTKIPSGEAGGSTASKRKYVAHIVRCDDKSILLVSGADKLHNARSIVADLRRIGLAVFDRFRSSRAETLEYYRALAAAFLANPDANRELAEEIDRVVREMERLTAELLAGA
jgi:(p)ppGpp synthase/HD superfamily hydrolase